MTALAEALLAAQRQAIGALGKQFVACQIDVAEVVSRLREIGCTDPADRDQMVAAWMILREYGSGLATNGASQQAPKMMSPAQKRRIELDCKDRGWAPPAFDAVPITLDEASAIIDSIKDGSYDPARWNPPF